MRPWERRPIEVAALLNPAFLALLVREFVVGFATNDKRTDPALLFLAVPLALHSDTRNALPKSIATKHHAWLESNQHLRVGAAERCRSLSPYVREGVFLALRMELVAIDDQASLIPTAQEVAALALPAESETIRCLKGARMLGRMLGRAGPTATVFSQWGIRP